MSAKIQFNQVIESISDRLDDALSKKFMRTLGVFAKKLIVARTRKGFGVPSHDSDIEGLDSLTANYIEYRKRIRLSRFTSPSKSNLTRSGRMLASLRVSSRNNKFEIEPSGRSREGVPNSDVAFYVQKAGRPFLFFSREELGKIRQRIEQHLGRSLKDL